LSPNNGSNQEGEKEGEKPVCRAAQRPPNFLLEFRADGGGKKGKREELRVHFSSVGPARSVPPVAPNVGEEEKKEGWNSGPPSYMEATSLSIDSERGRGKGRKKKKEEKSCSLAFDFEWS